MSGFNVFNVDHVGFIFVGVFIDFGFDVSGEISVGVESVNDELEDKFIAFLN